MKKTYYLLFSIFTLWILNPGKHQHFSKLQKNIEKQIDNVLIYDIPLYELDRYKEERSGLAFYLIKTDISYIDWYIFSFTKKNEITTFGIMGVVFFINYPNYEFEPIKKDEYKET